MSLAKELLCSDRADEAKISAILHCEKGRDDYAQYSQSYGYYDMVNFGSVQVLDFSLPNIYGEIYPCSVYAIYDNHESNTVNFGFSLSLDADERRTDIDFVYIIRLDTYIGISVIKSRSLYSSARASDTPLFSDTDINKDIPLYLSDKAPSFRYTSISA